MDRLLAGAVDRKRTAVRSHDRDPCRARLRGEAPQVAGHHRGDVGVYHRRRCPLVLPELRDEVTRDRERDVDCPYRLRDGALVVGARVRVEKGDRDRLGFARCDRRGELSEGLCVERHDLLALRTEASGYPQTVVAPNQGREPMADEGVELRTVLAADLDDVLEALVRDEHDAGSAALEQGVGGDGRSMEEKKVRFPAEDLTNAVEYRLSRVGGRRRNLECRDPSVAEEEEIGEGSARVDGEERR